MLYFCKYLETSFVVVDYCLLFYDFFVFYDLFVLYYYYCLEI